MSSSFTELGDICTTTQGVQVTKGNTSEKSYSGGYRYLYIADFISDKKQSFIDNKFEAKKVTDHDLVMANTGSPGRVFKGKDGILSNNLFKITFDLFKVDRDYLFYILSSNTFQYLLQKQMKGGIQKHLGHKTISRQKIPLPSLPEQQKIAAILDAADKLRQKDQQLIEQYNALSQSLFLDMFGDPVTNPMRWEKKKIIEVCSEIVDCVNKTAPVVDFGTNYKMIRTTNVRNYKVDLSTVRYVEKETYEKWVRRLTPKRGDIIFTREAPVGEAGVLESDDHVFLGQRIMEYRTNNKLMNSYYLLFELMGSSIKRQVQKLSAGSTVKHLSVPDCKKFLVNIPPITLQNQFAERIQAIEAQKQQAQASLKKSDDLFNSLLQRAFNPPLSPFKKGEECAYFGNE